MCKPSSAAKEGILCFLFLFPLLKPPLFLLPHFSFFREALYFCQNGDTFLLPRRELRGRLGLLRTFRNVRSPYRQEKSHERIIRAARARELVGASPQLPADGGHRWPHGRVVYCFLPLGRRWSGRKASQQGFPHDVQMRDLRRRHLFSPVCLDFCLSG